MREQRLFGVVSPAHTQAEGQHHHRFPIEFVTSAPVVDVECAGLANLSATYASVRMVSWGFHEHTEFHQMCCTQLKLLND